MAGRSFVREMEERAHKIGAWLYVLNDAYESLLSRREELSSLAGFDPEPRTRPCEHRRQWMHGRLCLACDNTGWRPCVEGEEGLDPYAAQISKGVTIVKDESPAAKQAREAQRLDAVIATLQRNARIRAGEEAPEDRSMRAFRLVQRRPRTVRRILRGLRYLQAIKPLLYDEFPSSRSLVALATVMYFVAPGPIEAPAT